MAKKKAAAGESQPSVTQIVTKWVKENPDAKPKAIVQHFADEGVTVSFSNAQKIRYNTVGGGKGGKKAAGGMNGAKVRGRRKKPARGEKSAVIRQLLIQHGKKVKPKVIIAAGAEMGYKVTYPEVSRLRKQVFGKKRGRKPLAAASNGVAHAPVKAAGGISTELLIEIHNFARKVGGRKVIERAFETLDLLAN